MSAACRRSRRAHGIPVWATFGTLAVVAERFEGMTHVYGFDSHDRFAIGALEIAPIPVPHDAREPVQYVIGDGARRVGVLTDLGVSTRMSKRACPAAMRWCSSAITISTCSRAATIRVR